MYMGWIELLQCSDVLIHFDLNPPKHHFETALTFFVTSNLEAAHWLSSWHLLVTSSAVFSHKYAFVIEINSLLTTLNFLLCKLSVF